ncbi:hypothetical protein [Haloarcula marismortui]|uniref:Uncharacterized protein n=2 Tax=Haloarcula marismortui (strain ATCC 43049 / DSM 3752 / JCM 8966 / VKM B-1809) TaxID=272569 RepID=A0A4P8JUT1_HALMA|nr:hypothetical protein [Haloarcula marismortui]QCP89774.1 hypothetical protein E6P14_02470 [Haloarcula marismortui ATCC 43049]
MLSNIGHVSVTKRTVYGIFYSTMDKQSLTRRAALGFIAGGGMLLVSESLAFTQTSARRKSDLDTAADANALLGLVDTSRTAQVSGENDTATVYKITDNIGSLSESDIDVSVVKLVTQDGTEVTSPPVDATVRNTGFGQFDVDISCTNKTDDLGDSYEVVLDFSATTDDISVTATRRTSPRSYVDISCTFDYGDSNNYRDGNDGDAPQPTDPSGNIENPAAVNDDDSTTAAALSSGGQEDLKVGYSLPAVDETAAEYEMIFDIERIQIGSGSFGFYLVNGAGQQLTTRQVLATGTNSYPFTDSEEQQIAANNDNLYLILDSDTNGKGNRELEIDYFERVS